MHPICLGLPQQRNNAQNVLPRQRAGCTQRHRTRTCRLPVLGAALHPNVDLLDLVGEPGVLEADPPTPSDAHASYFRLFLVGLWPLILTFPFSLAHGP